MEASEEASLLRTGVMIGSGIGGLNSIAETAVMINERGPRRISPFFIPGALINLISGQVSIRFGFKGPNHSVVTAVQPEHMQLVMQRSLLLLMMLM